MLSSVYCLLFAVYLKQKSRAKQRGT